MGCLFCCQKGMPVQVMAAGSKLAAAAADVSSPPSLTAMITTKRKAVLARTLQPSQAMKSLLHCRGANAIEAVLSGRRHYCALMASTSSPRIIEQTGMPVQATAQVQSQLAGTATWLAALPSMLAQFRWLQFNTASTNLNEGTHAATDTQH